MKVIRNILMRRVYVLRILVVFYIYRLWLEVGGIIIKIGLWIIVGLIGF